MYPSGANSTKEVMACVRRRLRRTGLCPDPRFFAFGFSGRVSLALWKRERRLRRHSPTKPHPKRSCRSSALYYPPRWLKASLGYPSICSLSIFNLSGGTAQFGRCHCSIPAESLLSFAGRADLPVRCTQ